MPTLWEEKPLATDIQIEFKEDRITVNFHRSIESGVAFYKITPSFIQEIIDMLKFKIKEEDFLHHLTINLKSPHNQLMINHKHINLEEVYKILESSITDFLEKEVNESALEKARKAQAEKNNRSCMVM